ncbi:phosphatidylinositol N-acetylglucosaminyltransferase subunit H [Babesia ovis]|uniref:Phosphatidylinositol N-acetylglucosaminyltransferase subunit H n=1 Tax=Babesia ovis TaxID=5869 RepID=A0A9W5TBN7_BABOV|nr:phosphatidylinositol N-acetylglucosaminyltransferase subunit H [Babesia ovis]
MTGNETKQLVSIADIDHLMINEGIVMNEVIFYLVITLKKSDKVLVPFGSVIPKLKWLQVVYRTYNEFFEAAKSPVLSN